VEVALVPRVSDRHAEDVSISLHHLECLGKLFLDDEKSLVHFAEVRPIAIADGIDQSLPRGEP
jgi:hypothetical protein